MVDALIFGMIPNSVCTSCRPVSFKSLSKSTFQLCPRVEERCLEAPLPLWSLKLYPLIRLGLPNKVAWHPLVAR